MDEEMDLPLPPTKPRLTKANQDLFEMMRSLMDEKFDSLGTQLREIRGEVGLNSNSIKAINDTVKSNRKDIDNIKGHIRELRKGETDEAKIEQIMERTLARKTEKPTGVAKEVQRLTQEVATLKNSPEPNSEEAKQYWFARRGVRCWPVQGNSETELRKSVASFFGEKLRIPPSNLEEDDVVEIRRIRPRLRSTRGRDGGGDKGGICQEVLVVMRDADTRDMVFRHASNLATWRTGENPNSIGIRLQIPTHMMGRFNTLNQHGFALRRRYGDGLRRHIRYDDSELDLVMDVRLPDEDEWIRVDYEFAREETRIEKKKRLRSARGRLSSLQTAGDITPEVRDGAPGSAPPTVQLTSVRRDNEGVFQWGSQ